MQAAQAEAEYLTQLAEETDAIRAKALGLQQQADQQQPDVTQAQTDAPPELTPDGIDPEVHEALTSRQIASHSS